MKTIWKYPFHVSDYVSIEMPRGAQILPHVEAAGQTMLVVWAKVDTDQPTETMTLAVVGTGNTLPTFSDHGTYIGTALAGPFVWHVFQPVMLLDEDAES